MRCQARLTCSASPLDAQEQFIVALALATFPVRARWQGEVFRRALVAAKEPSPQPLSRCAGEGLMVNLEPVQGSAPPVFASTSPSQPVRGRGEPGRAGASRNGRAHVRCGAHPRRPAPSPAHRERAGVRALSAQHRVRSPNPSPCQFRARGTPMRPESGVTLGCRVMPRTDGLRRTRKSTRSIVHSARFATSRTQPSTGAAHARPHF